MRRESGFVGVNGVVEVTEFNGMKIVESVYATKLGEPYEERRSWRERLFSRPWHPLRATRTVVPTLPAAFQIDDRTLVAHPAFIAQLRAVSPSPRAEAE